MKKFLSFLAAAAMLFTASCSNDDLGNDDGEEVLVSFSMNLDGATSTKAEIGDGTKVNKLVYSVFEVVKNNDGTTTTNYLTTFEKNNITFPTTEVIRLAKNKDYKIAFWAQNNECGAYSIDERTMNVTVSYDGYNNDEKRDAFFKAIDLNVVASVEVDVDLKRPFAQLNVGVISEDWEAAVVSNAKVLRSNVTISEVANKINLLTGEVEAAAEPITFMMYDIPTEMLMVDTNNDKVKEPFHYLSMSYLLVNDQNTVNGTGSDNVAVDFVFETVSNQIELNIPTVPVQRNYRTNILGQILTGNVTFNVYIDADFDGEYLEGALKIVKTREELQAALDAAQAGYAENIIVFGADITGDVYVHQKQNVNIIIDGRGNKYDGSIKIHNGSNYNNATLTIKDVDFETATESLNFIMPNEFGVENGVTRRYSNNILVENCTFKATGAAVNTAVGVQAKSTRNVTVLNCTATDMHSLIQAQSCGDNVVVKGCTINGKNGVAFKQVQNAVVEGTTITAAAYGIRYDGNIANYGITVKDNNVTAVQPFIVRKMTGANNTITLAGVNVLNPTDAPYQIVITNGSDDEAYSIPTGTYTLTGAEDFIVYPRDVVKNATEFDTALENKINNIVFADKVENVGLGFSINNDVVLNFNNNELNAGSTANSKWYALQIYGGNVEINDANFTRAGIAAMGGNVVFNSGKISHNPERSSRYIFLAGGEGTTVTINGGTFYNPNPSNSYFYAYNGGIIYVKGGNFTGSSTKKVVLSGGQVIITGGTFSFDPTTWVAAGYKATKSGSTWTVAAQ